MSQNKKEMLKAVLGKQRGLTPEDFADALELIRSMDLAELTAFYAEDSSRGTAASSENEMLRGVIQDVLKDSGVDFSAIETVIAADADRLQIGGKNYEIYVVAPDKTTRAREDVLLKELRLPNIPGFYSRRAAGSSASSGAVDISCHIVGLCFTDRVSLPMFLSSFLIEVSAADAERYNLRSKRIPISEKSFKASPAVWVRIFDSIQLALEQKYATSALCFRSFFVEALKKPASSKAGDVSLILDDARSEILDRQVEALLIEHLELEGLGHELPELSENSEPDEAISSSPPKRPRGLA